MVSNTTGEGSGVEVGVEVGNVDTRVSVENIVEAEARVVEVWTRVVASVETGTLVVMVVVTF